MKVQIRTVSKGNVVILAEEDGPYDVLIETDEGVLSITEDIGCLVRLTHVSGTARFVAKVQKQALTLSL